MLDIKFPDPYDIFSGLFKSFVFGVDIESLNIKYNYILNFRYRGIGNIITTTLSCLTKENY